MSLRKAAELCLVCGCNVRGCPVCKQRHCGCQYHEREAGTTAEQGACKLCGRPAEFYHDGQHKCRECLQKFVNGRQRKNRK